MAIPNMTVHNSSQTPTTAQFTLQSSTELKVYYMVTLYDLVDTEYLKYNEAMH